MIDASVAPSVKRFRHECRLTHHVQPGGEKHPAVAAAVHDFEHDDAAEFFGSFGCRTTIPTSYTAFGRRSRDEVFFRHVIEIRGLGSFGQFSQSGNIGPGPVTAGVTVGIGIWVRAGA